MKNKNNNWKQNDGWKCSKCGLFNNAETPNCKKCFPKKAKTLEL